MRRCLSLLLMLLFIACVNPVHFSSATSPAVLNIYPANGAVNVTFNNNVTHAVYLRANITDIDGDLKYIRFETNRTGNWTKIADTNITGNWTTSTYIIFSNLTKGARYWWRIKARDNSSNWTNTTSYGFKIKANATGGGNTGTSGAIITIVPSQPKSGGTVVFLINRSNASGYVICNATMNVYPIIFTQCLGSIVLVDADYGPALIYIVNYGTKIFTVKHQYEGVLLIDAPSSADVNTKVDVAVMSQGQYIASTLSFTSPSNHVNTRQTGTVGPISYTFAEAGNWTLQANAYYSNATRKIYINPEPITIQIDSNIKVNRETAINVNSPNAHVMIRKGDATWTYTSDSNGDVLFTPLFSGQYTVTATSSNQEGAKTFNVQSSTDILVTNTKGKATITDGDILIIEVQDGEGNSVKSGALNIFGDDLPLKNIELSGKTTYWTATPQAKIYKFTYTSDSELLTSSQEEIAGVPPDMTLIYVAVAVVAIIVFIIVLLLNRTGYLSIGALKGLSGGVKDDLL
jgi:hypothetical protein